MGKKYTIKDVAKLAGVSIATVSRMATGSTRVSQAAALRVHKAAAELGINLNRRGKSPVLAFLLSNCGMLHPLYLSMLAGAETFCAQHEWSILFMMLNYSPTAQGRNLHVPRLLSRRDLLSGVIVCGVNTSNLLERLERERFPFAVLGNTVLGEWSPDQHDVVWFEDIQGTAELTRHLLSLGHRDIWFVGNRRLTWFARRYEGYCQAMREAGLELHLSEVDAEKDSELGYLATKSLLAKGAPVSAIVAGGDLVAEGVCRALRDSGLRIADDVSVAAVHDFLATYLAPPLTTVRVFTEQIGKSLAQMVLNRIERPHLGPQQVVIPTQLVKRESCLPLNGARQAAGAGI